MVQKADTVSWVSAFLNHPVCLSSSDHVVQVVATRKARGVWPDTVVIVIYFILIRLDFCVFALRRRLAVKAFSFSVVRVCLRPSVITY